MEFCTLKIIDEFGEIEKEFNNLTSYFIKKLNSKAKEENLIFLSVIDENDCNIYSKKQVSEIKNELIILKSSFEKQDNQEYITLLEATDNILSTGEYTYLKISSLKKENQIKAPFQQFLW